MLWFLQQLQQIQSRLFDVGSVVATPLEKSTQRKLQRVSFDPAATPLLETWIDAMDKQLPSLTNFILPSGTPAIAAPACIVPTATFVHHTSLLAQVRRLLVRHKLCLRMPKILSASVL